MCTWHLFLPQSCGKFTNNSSNQRESDQCTSFLTSSCLHTSNLVHFCTSRDLLKFYMDNPAHLASPSEILTNRYEYLIKINKRNTCSIFRSDFIKAKLDLIRTYLGPRGMEISLENYSNFNT